jgi:mannose-6-phosphate isomerase-like protein (cupin superfamily)
MRKNPLIIEKPEMVKKGWGHEVQIINTDEYCGKVLHFNQGAVMSLHYHINKHETWYVFKGSIAIKGVNPDTAEDYQIIAYEGSVIDIPRGIIHQVEALTNADVFEVSTPDNWEDNYRVRKGDSQK